MLANADGENGQPRSGIPRSNPSHDLLSCRGRPDAPVLNALFCLSQGKSFSASAPGAALFCREKQV